MFKIVKKLLALVLVVASGCGGEDIVRSLQTTKRHDFDQRIYINHLEIQVKYGIIDMDMSRLLERSNH